MSRTVARRSQLIVELERQRDLLRRQQKQDQRVLQALSTISLACRDRLPLRTIFETIHSELASIFSFDACYIALCDADRPEHFRAVLMIDEGVAEYLEAEPYSGLSGQIVRSREPLLFRDLVAERDPDQPRVPFGASQKRSRAWLGVPLKIGAEAVGVLSLQSYQIGVYNALHRDLLQRIADVTAIALESVRLIERHGLLSAALSAQVTARTEELNAVSTVADALVARQSLPQMLDRALAVALELFGLDAGNVRLLDETRTELILTAQRGFSDAYFQRTLRSQLSTSPIRDVVRENRPQVIRANWYARLSASRTSLDVFPRFACALSVPLAIGDSILGTLSLFGFTPRDFADHEVRLAQVVANQIAIGVENTRLIAERERQIGELRTLSAVSAAASTAHTLNELLRRVHDALQSFIRLDAFAMVIYDAERGIVIDGLTIDEGYEYAYWQSQPPPPRSLTAHILRTGKALRFNDLLLEAQALADLELAVVGTTRMAASWMGTPLLDREGRTIGIISVKSYTPYAFVQRDEAFLASVAAQVALHVQNVRLLNLRERQIRELEVIGQIGKLVTASYDLAHMLDETYRLLVELSEAAVFFLLICEPQSRLVTHAVFVEEGAHIPLDVVGNTVTPGSMSDWILSNREPLLFADFVAQRAEATRRGIAPRPVGPANPVRSWAGVPLVARDGELIGVLSLQDYRPYRYDSTTIDFLSQVASHVSLGVQKMRLFEERERQAAENARLAAEAQAHADAAEAQAHRMELVHRITAVLSDRLDQQEVLEIASRELVQLFWADHTGTVLFNNEEWGIVIAEYPPTGTVGAQIPLSANPLFTVLQETRRPIQIVDIANDPLAAASRALWQELGISSIVIVPLISRDRVIGSISLDNVQSPRRFRDDELDLMMTVATSVAAAVENARLFAAEQAQRRTADTLREMARVLSSSFDPAEVLRLVLGELQRVIAYDTASIMLLDGALLRVAASRGWPAAEEPRSFVIPLEGSAAGEVVRRGEPVLRASGRAEGTWVRSDVGGVINAWLGVPLIARGRVLGVLNIDAHIRDHFSERDIEVARTFANHAALAIENAQLYQESVARVEQELEIARRIQANLFPRELPQVTGLSIAARCLPARETGGDFYDVVDFGTRIGVIVGDVSGKSLPAAMLMAVARSTARSEARNHETPWVVLSETNHWLVDDVPRNAFVALSYALVDRAGQRLYLSNAGQLTPLIRHADGTLEYLEVPAALPLGLRRDLEVRQMECAIGPGDTLLFYTDGIVEAHDQLRKLFGFERLERIFATWGHLSPAELIEVVLSEVHAFAEGMPAHDDMTLVVVRLE
jgi:phosphoserine phosphatase RsbU/P